MTQRYSKFLQEFHKWLFIICVNNIDLGITFDQKQIEKLVQDQIH